MKKHYALFALSLAILGTVGTYTSSAQSVGIAGSVITPDAQSILDIRSTSKGVLLPRMTTAQRTALSPTSNSDDGLMVYDVTLDAYMYWDGTAWQTVGNGAASTLDEAYDGGGSGLGRAITADSGPVSITVGGATTIGLTTTGNLQLATDNAWIGAGSTIERIIFDQTLSRIDLEAADITLTDGKWFGIDASHPNLLFQGGSTDRLNVNNASITIDDGKWFGIGSTVERIQFDATNGEINILGADVGIGTTAPDNQSLLDIRSTAKGVLFPRLTTAQRDAIGQGNATDYGLWIYNTTDGNYNYWDGTSWQTVPTLTQATDADWFQTLSTSIPTAITDWIYTEGHVGIGVGASSNPSAPLQVAASGAGNPDANSILAYNPTNASGEDAIITARVAGASAGDPFFSLDISGETGWSIGADNSHANRLKIANSWNNLSSGTKMTIMTDGNVGIGTDSPTSDLDVRGTSVSDGAVLQVANSDASHYLRLFGGKSTDPNPFLLWKSGDPLRFATDASGWSEKMRIQSDGNVGIGTTTPDAKLNVGGATGSSIYLTREDNITAVDDVLGSILFDSTDDTAPSSNDASVVIRGFASQNHGNSNKGGYLTFLTKDNVANTTAATERMRIQANGNIGIGTTAPAQKLDVSGDVNSSTGFRLANTATSGQYLRGNGSRFVSSAIQASDLPGSGQISVATSGVGLGVSGSPVSLGGTVTITSNATSSNTASTLVSRDASGNFSAGLITADLNGQWKALDDRIIEPNSITSTYAKFGFTSYNNNNTAPYADYLHLRSYQDASGGNDNLVMFAKDQIAMRVYQQAWNSVTPYSTYKTVAFVEDLSNFSGLANSSATIGLTPVNGTATTALRSDAAPALSQAIVPTWTGTHTFSNATYSALFTGGNVGIGTSTPAYPLDARGYSSIGGKALVAGAGNELWTQPQTNGPATLYINYRGYADAATQFRSLNVSNGKNASIAFFDGPSGNVGIGATSPGAKLDVYSASDAGIRYSGIRTHRPASFGQYAFMDYAYSSSAAYFGSVYTGSPGVYGSIHFRQYTQSNVYRDAMNIISSGNVGIGTSSPAHQLSVGTATADGQAITIRGYSNSPASWKGGGAFGYSTANVIMGQLNGVAQLGGHNGVLTAWADLSINSGGGNVGIGTTTPTEKLSVAGAITSANFKVKRDFATWNTAVNSTNPIHIKTNITFTNIMYRILVEGYNYGASSPNYEINSSVCGYAYQPTGLIANQANNNLQSGVSISQYKSSDGYVVIKLQPQNNSYYIGFTVSGWFLNPTGTGFDIKALTIVQQASNL